MPELLKGVDSLEKWGNMQMAAVFAMLALSNTTSGPASALSYYLGTHFNVPHGIAGAAFIGKVSRHNHENGYHDYADLFCRYKKSEDDLSKIDRSERVVEKIEKLLHLAGGALHLSEVGVTDEDYDGFLEFFEGSQAAFAFNPVAIGEEHLLKFLK